MRFALFLGTIAYLLLRSVERFTFFSLYVLVKGRAVRFSNILIANNIRIAN